MYIAIAPLVGALITYMNGVNSRFSATVGSLLAALVVHLVGLATVSLVLLFAKEKRIPGRLPFYAYLGGFIGVGTLLSCNYSYGRLGASLAVALALLGQTLASLVVDATGFLGRKRYPLRAKSLPGIVLVFAGAFVMGGDWQGEGLAILVGLAAGVCTCLGVIFNSAFGTKKGVFHSVRMNFLMGGATILAILAIARAAPRGERPGPGEGGAPPRPRRRRDGRGGRDGDQQDPAPHTPPTRPPFSCSRARP